MVHAADHRQPGERPGRARAADQHSAVGDGVPACLPAWVVLQSLDATVEWPASNVVKAYLDVYASNHQVRGREGHCMAKQEEGGA